jgi:hypothetical protein
VWKNVTQRAKFQNSRIQEMALKLDFNFNIVINNLGEKLK